MFLRGYGSQDYSQVNRHYFWGDDLKDKPKTNTHYSSGELGKVQGDSIRNWYSTSAFRSYVCGADIERLDYSATYLGESSSNSVYQENVDNGAVIFDSHDYENYSIQFPIIRNAGPCLEGELSSEFRIVYNMICSGINNPIANEIRPVNIAVRYYIKAK